MTSLWAEALHQLDRGARHLHLEPMIVERLKKPKRILLVSVPVRMDDVDLRDVDYLIT